MADRARKNPEAEILAIARELDSLLSDLGDNVADLTSYLAEAAGQQHEPPPDTGPQERLVLP
jgi:hypothetical protein